MSLEKIKSIFKPRVKTRSSVCPLLCVGPDTLQTVNMQKFNITFKLN